MKEPFEVITLCLDALVEPFGDTGHELVKIKSDVVGVIPKGLRESSAFFGKKGSTGG